jgi:predicted esterase
LRALVASLVLVIATARPAFGQVLEGWPCTGCITIAPGLDDGGAGSGPRPLLVALHGDGGSVRAVVRAWKSAAAREGVILLAPECPRDLGCTAGSYWQWKASSGHDPKWLGAQIDAVAARFPVDPKRVFATGYSGGATYLGWYAPVNADRLAAVAHIAGGMPYRPSCPACKTPVLFVLGASDPMIGPYTRPLREWYEACGGHEIVWETLPGVTHESILQVLEGGRAKQILGWLLARPLACADAGVAGPSLESDAGDQAEAGPVARVDASPSKPAPSTPSPPQVPPPHGCACSLHEGRSISGLALAIAVGLVAARRRRRTE